MGLVDTARKVFLHYSWISKFFSDPPKLMGFGVLEFCLGFRIWGFRAFDSVPGFTVGFGVVE